MSAEYSTSTPSGSAATPASSLESSTPDANSLCYVLGWHDPVATGKLFFSIIAGLILVKVNVVSIGFHALYIALLLSAAAEYIGKLVTGQGFVTKYLGTKPKSQAQTFRKTVLPAIGDFAGAAETEIYKVVFAQDIESTLKAAGVSYILYKLTSWFSVYTLVFATVLLAFSFPPFYQRNKKEIDAAVAQYTKLAKDKASEAYAVAHKKAAPHLETLSKKSGPVGSFLQSKFPTRTAGSTVNSKPTAPVAEKTTGVSTGASQFPLVPQSAPSGVSEVEEIKTTVADSTL